MGAGYAHASSCIYTHQSNILRNPIYTYTWKYAALCADAVRGKRKASVLNTSDYPQIAISKRMVLPINCLRFSTHANTHTSHRIASHHITSHPVLPTPIQCGLLLLMYLRNLVKCPRTQIAPEYLQLQRMANDVLRLKGFALAY